MLNCVVLIVWILKLCQKLCFEQIWRTSLRTDWTPAATDVTDTLLSESQYTPEETDFNSVRIRGIVMLVIQQHDAVVLQEFLSWKSYQMLSLVVSLQFVFYISL